MAIRMAEPHIRPRAAEVHVASGAPEGKLLGRRKMALVVRPLAAEVHETRVMDRMVALQREKTMMGKVRPSARQACGHAAWRRRP